MSGFDPFLLELQDHIILVYSHKSQQEFFLIPLFSLFFDEIKFSIEKTSVFNLTLDDVRFVFFLIEILVNFGLFTFSHFVEIQLFNLIILVCEIYWLKISLYLIISFFHEIVDLNL